MKQTITIAAVLAAASNNLIQAAPVPEYSEEECCLFFNDFEYEGDYQEEVCYGDMTF